MAHSEQIPFLGIQASENVSLSLNDRFRMGDEAAFEVIYGDLRKLIFKFIRDWVRNFEDADDLTEEVFIVAFKKRAKFDPNQGTLKMWLYGIARNMCLTFGRDNARENCSRVIIPEDSEIDDVLDQQSYRDRSIEERLSDAQQAEDFLRRLSKRQREVVILTVCDDLSDKEAAVLLGISEKTVAVHRFKALKQMREESK